MPCPYIAIRTVCDFATGRQAFFATVDLHPDLTFHQKATRIVRNEYHFVTRWRVRGTVREVSDVLSAVEDLPRWWPAVYLDVQELEPGDDRGIGKRVSLHTRGWLPYTLRWQFRVTESREPYGYTFEAFSDFVGRGIWTFEQDGAWVNMTYDWKVRAEKPLLRYFSGLLRPIFSANHRWAMAKGEKSFRIELARRQALR